MGAALEYLQELVARGVKYPDAEWMAAVQHGVTCDELREAYDQACAA